jgi:predicted metalloprotease
MGPACPHGATPSQVVCPLPGSPNHRFLTASQTPPVRYLRSRNRRWHPASASASRGGPGTHNSRIRRTCCGHDSGVRRRLILLLLLVVAPVAVGCGSTDVDRARERLRQARADVEQRVQRTRLEFERRRAEYGRRIEQILGDLQKAVPSPRRTSPVVRSRGRHEPETIDAFLTDLLRDIDGYWTRTLAANDLPAPRIHYDWVPPGARRATGCGHVADDRAAFYCPTDDTIYVAQEFAAQLYNGVAQGLPGQSAGYGRATGDFAVAYVLAHEYGHNIQQELGIFDNTTSTSAEPFELQADCFAGTWSNSVYEQGHLESGDLEEATNAALAVGDFDVGNAQHHGTPQQRRDALLAGFRSGDPSTCGRYVDGST